MQLLEQHIRAISDICKNLKIAKMYVFGSYASNTYSPDSDIDLLISFEDTISIEEYTNNYFDLHYKLRALLNKKIDIITEKSLANPIFIKSVNASKKIIYEG